MLNLSMMLEITLRKCWEKNLEFQQRKQPQQHQKIKRSTALDRRKVVLRILDSYEEITITDQQDDFVFFEIGGKEYIFWYPERDQDTSSPVIFVKNDSSYDYPHILPTGIPLDKKFENKYRYICLDENDNKVYGRKKFLHGSMAYVSTKDSRTIVCGLRRLVRNSGG